MRTGLLIALLLPFCSSAPLDTNVDAEADRVQDGTHSHRDGNAYIHNKADIDVSFSGDTEFNDLSIGHHMEVNVHGDGGGHIQVCTAGKVNQECFCDNGQEGGQDCAAEQVCTSGGACLDVCTAGKVNQACFCDNGQGGGQDCAAEQVCTSGGACLDAVDGGWSNWSEYGQCSKSCGGGHQTRMRTCTNPVPQHKGRTCEQQNIGDPTETTDCNLQDCVTCPGEDGLSSVLLENNWKTQDQINEMTEEQKKTAVIAEVVKITAHTTSDLEGRANAGDLGSLISIANMASLLIKYSIKLSSDVKTMTYNPDLRNALITEISRHPSMQVSQLESKTDDQLLKIFCKACPADAKITSDCMCGGNSCTVGNVCVAGSTCTPVCTAGALNSADCFCENAQLGQGGEVCTTEQGCNSDGTCLDACSRERKKLVSDCLCSTIFESVLCPAGNICNQDGMCMDVCNDDENRILENGCYCGPQLQPCRKGSACFATSDEADAMCHPNIQLFFILLG